jgi:hypothetical protein
MQIMLDKGEEDAWLASTFIRIFAGMFVFGMIGLIWREWRAREVIGPDGTSATGSFESGSGPITPSTATLTDSNGNIAKLSVNSGVYTATDSLGRPAYTTNIPIGLAAPTPVGTYYLTTLSESGSAETDHIYFSQEQIVPFTMPHPTSSEIGAGMTVNPPAYKNSTFTAVSEIDLQDSNSPSGKISYLFAYDPTYGTISKITFPTGGYVRFCWGVRDKDWTGDGDITVISSIVVIAAFTSTGGGTAGGCDPPTAGSGENQWTYAMESLDNSSVPIGKVTAPDGTYTSYVGTCSFDFTAITVFGGKKSCKESSRSVLR